MSLPSPTTDFISEGLTAAATATKTVFASPDPQFSELGVLAFIVALGIFLVPPSGGEFTTFGKTDSFKVMYDFMLIDK